MVGNQNPGLRGMGSVYVKKWGIEFLRDELVVSVCNRVFKYTKWPQKINWIFGHGRFSLIRSRQPLPVFTGRLPRNSAVLDE
ncbi:MAG: hypothetical protein D6743_05700 [Calditrichaeota bacterium]|nr:MAG: hypothetical protein D6743_05700 [Calditrichota bacterium]